VPPTATTAAPALEGMPDPETLQLVTDRGETVVLAGQRVLLRYPEADIGMRRLAMVALTQAGRPVKDVAAAFEVHPNYLSTLRKTAREEGSVGLVKVQGRPVKLTEAQREQARRWSEEGVTGQEIARRLQVSDSMISRLVVAGRRVPDPVQDWLPGIAPDSADPAGLADPDLAGSAPAECVDLAGSDAVIDAGLPEPAAVPAGSAEPAAAAAGGSGTGSGGAGMGSTRLGVAGMDSRYAGAMLLHAFFDRVDAGSVFAPLTGPPTAPPAGADPAGADPAGADPAGAGPVGGARVRRFDDVAVLTATSMAFALGVGSVEATKHLLREQVGPLAGLTRLPELRTLRPHLAGLAEHCDPLALQADLARAMLTADAPLLNLYFVDDHFVPYEGAKPVGKGYNTKRRTAQRGLADTMVTDYHGRAVCFVTGPPSGLTKTLPAALAELRRVAGEAKIMLGFDRGGAYAQVFTHCRDHQVDWITYGRGKLAATTAPARRYWRVDTAGRAETLTLADETVTIKDYGPARQLTLFEHDQPVLQILTSDLDAPAAALVAWLRCRWRIENVFKYITAHHGMDWLCHYGADLLPDTTPIPNPAREQARDQVKHAETTLTEAQRALTLLLRSDRPIAEINTAIPAAEAEIDTAETALADAKAQLKTIPAKIPANQHNLDAKRAILRTQRRSLQMVLRLLAFNAEQWLADRLNTYLADNNEYRATLRHLLHLGGHITYTPETITVALDRPATPKITRALRLLLAELNATPPRIPGDPRPITYKIKTA
jgi:DNA-binding CsgD family transcriptional regulator